MEAAEAKERFISIYEEHITRPGSAELLEYLTARSDFFTSPASTRYHGAFEGGLVIHSLNVYDCLVDYLSRPRVQQTYGLQPTPETVAVISLLHDLCKVNCYQVSYRNVKDESGSWYQKPYYVFDDPLPYGHGEKSVYMISGYMRLSREEAFAIRYHMGFSGNEDKGTVGSALQKYPLAFALSVADMEATYFLEG